MGVDKDITPAARLVAAVQGGEGPGCMADKDAVLITPYRDGPLLIRGDFKLLDSAGRRIDTQRRTVALCRCGKSRIRPFCDGTHKLIGFQAPRS